MYVRVHAADRIAVFYRLKIRILRLALRPVFRRIYQPQMGVEHIARQEQPPFDAKPHTGDDLM